MLVKHRFKEQEFWAEGGVVCMEDQDTGEFKCLTRAEAAGRAVALNAILPGLTYPSERDELSKCVVALCAAVKEAKNQGDPTKAEVVKEKIKSMRKVSMITGPEPNGYRDGGLILHSERFRKLRI